MGRPPKSLKDRNVILTLDPIKFAEKKQKPLHIGNIQAFTLRISLLKQSSLVTCNRLDYGLKWMNGASVQRLRYPPVKAFLYYSMPPEKPRFAGELRLRVTSGDDPASFESGSDLLRTNSQPWSRPLYILQKHYLPLYEKLREERFIPDNFGRSFALKMIQFLFVITEQGATLESLTFNYVFHGLFSWICRKCLGSI